MKKNFSFNFNSNLSLNGKKVFSNTVNENQDLTAQQEYWLNKILRDYGGKIFILTLLFIALMFAIVFAAFNANQTQMTGNVQINSQ